MIRHSRARRSGERNHCGVLSIAVPVVLLVAIALTGCSGNGNKAATPATSAPSAAAATAPAATPLARASSPTSQLSTPSSSLASATPGSITGSATPFASIGSATPAAGTGTPSATDQAIMATIQRANNEQQQALAQGDPTVMRDTATPAYYAMLVQTLRDLANGGVGSIKLLGLAWGPSTIQGTNAQATTFETWQTTFVDNTVAQSRDRNVYSLVQQGSGWLIAADSHPDSQLKQPGPAATPGPSGAIPPAGSGSSGQSRNWSGYVASGGGPFTSVTGSWTVPTVQANGTSGGADATWVGIGGAGSFDLIQAGTQATVTGPGQVEYGAWMETLPQPSQPVTLVVHPGDAMTVTLTQQGSGSWQISIVDKTTTQQFQTTVQYTSSLSSAEWIEEAPSAASAGLHVITLDNFGSVQVSNAMTTSGGKQQTIAQAGGQAVTMYGRGGQPLASPSALGADGGSFTVTRL